MHSFNLSAWVLLATLLSNVLANPLATLEPRYKKHHNCTKPKVFIISMVITHGYACHAVWKANEK